MTTPLPSRNMAFPQVPFPGPTYHARRVAVRRPPPLPPPARHGAQSPGPLRPHQRRHVPRAHHGGGGLGHQHGRVVDCQHGAGGPAGCGGSGGFALSSCC